MKSFTKLSPISQLLWLAFIFLMLLIVTSGVTIVLPLLGVDISQVTVQVVLQGVTQLLTFLLAPLILIAFTQEEKMDYFKLRFTGTAWKQGGVAFVMIILLVPVIDWLTVWNEGWSLGGGTLEATCRHLSQMSEQLINQFLSQTGVGSLLLNILVIALIPAVSEELFFRGAIQQILQRWMKGNAHWAILTTAVIFSLAHGDLFGFIPRLLLGMVLGYLFWYSGSLLVNICAHFANNVLIVVLYFFCNQEGLMASASDPIRAHWLLTLICTLAAALLFFTYVWKKGKPASMEKELSSGAIVKD